MTQPFYWRHSNWYEAAAVLLVILLVLVIGGTR